MSSFRMSEDAYAAHRAKRAAELARQDGHALPRKPGKVWLVLPWPPTGNHNVKHGNGGHYMTEEHKEYRAKVARAVIDRQLPKLSGRLRMEVSAFPPDKRRRDLDNLLKPIADALQHAGLYADDNQIDQLEIRRIHGPVEAKVSVTVTEIGE